MLARGHIALSVTLSAITSLVCFLTTPLSFFFWSSLVAGLTQRVQSFEISFFDLLLNMIAILLLPLLAGMAFAHYFPKSTEKISKTMRTVSILILITFIVVAFMNNFDVFKSHILSVFWIVFLHNGLGLLGAYYFSQFSLRIRNLSTDPWPLKREFKIPVSDLFLSLHFFKVTVPWRWSPRGGEYGTS